MPQRHTPSVAGPNEQIVRQAIELINSSETVDEAMQALEPVMDPGIEWVNPPDAVERGTRKGEDGMRKVLENFIAGTGVRLTIEVQEVVEDGDRVLAVSRTRARGSSSGAEALGQPVGVIYTFREGRLIRIEWHTEVDEARARFGRGEK